MIDIINNSSISINNADTKSLISRLLKLYNISTKNDIEIVFVNQNTIKKYNFEFRNIDKSTNVLSFPAIKNENDLNKHIFGTIMICPEYIKEVDNNTDINKYIIHGFLHLLGYNHDDDKNEKIFYEEFKNISKKINLKELY